MGQRGKVPDKNTETTRIAIFIAFCSNGTEKNPLSPEKLVTRDNNHGIFFSGGREFNPFF